MMGTFQDSAVVTVVPPDRFTEAPATAPGVLWTGDLLVGKGRGDGAVIQDVASRGRRRPQVRLRGGLGAGRGGDPPSPLPPPEAMRDAQDRPRRPLPALGAPRVTATACLGMASLG